MNTSSNDELLLLKHGEVVASVNLLTKEVKASPALLGDPEFDLALSHLIAQAGAVDEGK